MGRWRTHVETWLAAEQDDRDDAAEAALGQAFVALPRAEPSPTFVARTVEAAWAARVGRRRLAGLTAAAAAVLVVTASAVVLYAALAWLLSTGATVASVAMRSALMAAVTIAGWWSTAAGVGLTLANAIASPYSMAALTAMEFVAVAAFVMLHRLLRSDVEVRTPRAYCF